MRVSLLAAFSVIVAATASAQATVVVDQPAMVDVWGTTSAPVYPSGYIRAFDDFKLSADHTITTVSWVGDVTGQPFQIGFSTDAGGGLPDLTFFANETVSPTSNSAGAYSLIYTATLPTPVGLLANTDYWISIYSTYPLWHWDKASNAPSPGALPAAHSVAYLTVTGIPSWGRVGYDLAFRLEDNTAPPPPPPPAVPEPASLFLLAAGAIGLRWTRKQRQGAG